MTAYSPARFPYDTEDKGLDYSSQILEDPFNEVFEQYIVQTSADLSHDAYESNSFEFPDLLRDGETTSSGSYITDSTSIGSSYPNFESPQTYCRKVSQPSLSKTAFLPQNYNTRNRREKLQPAISGRELLLGIEQKSDPCPQSVNPPLSIHVNEPAIPLRRKPKFDSSARSKEPDRSRHITKSSRQHLDDQSAIMRPSYHYQEDLPEIHEWTHGLEQLSLQPPDTSFSISSPPNAFNYDPEQRSGIATPHENTLRHQFFQEDIRKQVVQMQGDLQTANNSSFNLNMTSLHQSQSIDPIDLFGSPAKNDDFGQTSSLFEEQQQLHHCASWVSLSPHEAHQVPSSPTQTDWPLDPPATSDGYYTNALASKSAPAIGQQSNIEFPMDQMIAPNYNMPTTNATEPSQKIFARSTHRLVSHTASRSYNAPPMLSPLALPPPPESPSCQAPSSSPSYPSPHRHRRTKSTPHPKSAKRPKSVGNLKAPRTPTSMGFVNFTPSDSRRLLTGVAPSGSSKTKARREQEANEKKRKLSQAVLRAVEEAGGDADSLRKEGLLIDE